MSQTQQQQPQQQPSNLIVFEGFSGLNTQPTRYGIGDKEAFIMDGFFPAGNDNARVIPDNSLPLVSFTPNVAYFDFANIGATPYSIVFLNDGSVWSLNTSTLIETQIAAPGTIQNPGSGNIAISQWGSQFVLIVSVQTNGYFIWDGTTFYVPGDAVPGFTTVPTGISGNAIETYSGYVWIGNGDTLIWSAPGSITDFTTMDGGGSLASNDSSLRVQYTELKQSNGYLYLFGDSSIAYVAGPTTSGDPLVTSFSLQNVDPEVGTPWPNTVDVLGSNIVFANAWGAHVSFGGRAAKISPELDGIYNSVPNFGSFIPSAVKAILFGKRIWALLLPVVDQVTFQQVNKFFLWDGKPWCSAQQSADIIFCQHQEINSVLTAWGTDGVSMYRLFNTPSTNLSRTLQSKLWAPLSYAWNKAEGRIWGIIQIYSGTSADVTISVDSENGSAPITFNVSVNSISWVNNSQATVAWINNSDIVVAWTSIGSTNGLIVLPPAAVGQNGALVGLTLTTTAQDMAIISLATMPEDVGYRG